MNRLLKKRMLIVSISLALLLLINIGVSYSYYLGKVVGNESDTTLSFKSAGILINYENNSDTIDVSNVAPGWSATKNFSVSSTISENQLNQTTSNLWYEIYLYVEKNDFPDNVLTYSFDTTNNNVGGGLVAESRTNIGLPLSTELNVITIGTGNFVVGENVHNYSITFDYSSEKTNYPNCMFNARVGVKAIVESVIYLNVDGGEIEGDTTKYVSKGGTITLQTPSKENAVFGGWAITSGDATINGNELTVNSALVEVQAVWIVRIEQNSILNVNLDGGTWSGDTLIQIKTNNIIKLEKPTRDGYIFIGWEIVEGNGEISGDNIVAYDESLKIIAVWESVIPDFTYTGTYHLLKDGGNNWRIKFLTSGTLKFTRLGNAESGIDVFLVGGGGSGNNGANTIGAGGGGGGGGYTTTKKGVSVATGTTYSITVGSSGGTSKAFSYSANPGSSSNGRGGGNGGSGGGSSYGAGGSDGGNGGRPSDTSYIAGKGQGTTTREFGESTGDLYAGGGGGSNQSSGLSGGAGGGGNGCGIQSGTAASGTANTGGGGGGGKNPGSGGSGIVIIRNKR